MKIFITGGTGYIGSVLVKVAKDSGYDVTVMTRSEEKAKQLNNDGVQTLVGDLLVDGPWQQFINEVDAVIHLAAPPTWGKKVTAKIAQSYAVGHLDMTKRLFEAIDPQNLQKIIYVGGTSYFGDAGDGDAQSEEYRSEPKGWGPYIAGSIDLAKQYATQGYPVTIVYPAQIYGPTSWMEQLYLQPLHTKKAVIGLKGYNVFFSPIHIVDCGRAFLHLIEHGENGEDYILSDNHPLPSKEFRKEIEVLMGVTDAKTKLVPRWVCKIALGPVLTEYATANTNFSNAKLLETGFEFQYPTYKDGLPNVVEDWLSQQVK